ncbi:MAG TPA: hypothetical protein VEI54_12380 [Candidatus Limnocylindrales bacterium]|nr:hypothetical protein [Candidatus Limnocylindrales bacterium]
MMTLKEVVDRYNALAGKGGKPVPLSALGLSVDDTVRLFTALDEDYHISRYLHFSRAEGQGYRLGEETVTHVAIDEAISTLL